MMSFQVLKNFSINTLGGERILQPGQIITLPENKAKALIDRGKIKGLGIIWDVLSGLHLQTCRGLAAEKVNLRLQSREITEAEDRLNEVWHLCLRGQATLDDFRAVNEKWSFAVKSANEKAKKVRLF